MDHAVFLKHQYTTKDIIIFSEKSKLTHEIFNPLKLLKMLFFNHYYIELKYEKKLFLLLFLCKI